MSEHSYLRIGNNQKIAYRMRSGTAPGVIFFSGFGSSMDGKKANFLDDWAQKKGCFYLRFDYSGHGLSSGKFEDGTISKWKNDADKVVFAMGGGKKHIFVGSSMGAWIALLLARKNPGQVGGILTISGAPDFTENCIWSTLDEAQRRQFSEDGRLPPLNGHEDSPPITFQLVEDGRKNLIFERALACPFPVRILHGSADSDVPPKIAKKLFRHLKGDDISMTLVKGSSHSFSAPENLDLIGRQLDAILDLQPESAESSEWV